MPNEMSDDEWETAPPGSMAGYDVLLQEYVALRKNRWAAFTDDELEELARWSDQAAEWTPEDRQSESEAWTPLIGGILDELARRREAAP